MSGLSTYLLVLCLAGQLADDSLPTEQQVRTAVQRSLPYLMKEGFSWKTGKKCISCHHIPLAVWTHNEAKAKKFAVDQEQIDTLTDWMIGFSAAKKLTSQRDDGTWPAVSRPIANHRNYVTENFGTGWATLGLLRTLP